MKYENNNYFGRLRFRDKVFIYVLAIVITPIVISYVIISKAMEMIEKERY